MPPPNPDDTLDQPFDPSVGDRPTVGPPPASDRTGSHPSAEWAAAATAAAPPDTHFGRYRVTGLLGRGGMGTVYRGFDDLLGREVAIKVPLRERVADPARVAELLAEARVVAAIDHPHVLRVHDCGRTADGRCYVVSQVVDGGDLAARLRHDTPPPDEAARLVAAVADALAAAHAARVVHRDVKPSNIFLDRSGRPYLADFGLAMREEDFGRGSGFAGTPRYMSPEQASGEGHRVGPRSDVYSLGVVLYELLAGQPPFAAAGLTQLLDQIQAGDPPPPRQFAAGVPPELERVCLKAMAVRAADRYDTAADFATDLRLWLVGPSPRTEEPPGAPPLPAPPPSATELTDSHVPSVKIVPKGLRAFDATDRDFFLALVPGPRDRHGLPESLRYWQTRIEEDDPDQTFSVGLLYGPSGCGKSSLVKAGLLPRLGLGVRAVMVEATADDTERRLVQALHRRVPEVTPDAPVADAVTLLRRRPLGPKVVIVIDQFEQWLAGRGETNPGDLLRALRQCDGGRVQALLLVRDDFWMAATRLFRDLEIPLREGQNSAAVDRFDARHARAVLTLFGQAYGALPPRPTPEQRRFLADAVDGLAAGGPLVPVRLGLFAETVKARPWVPATLHALGGAEGVGAAFLEESLDGPNLPPERRLHAAAARAVLKALLPPVGSDLRGPAASRAALRQAAGYEDRPGDFDELMRVLDSDLRLMTPADRPDGDGDGERRYQLTHDALVPALRQWLGRKQRETRRGRAELLLAERAALWRAKPLHRFLPSLPEWARIRLLSRRRGWSDAERRMMTAAGRWHLTRLTAAAVVVGGGLFAGWRWYGGTHSAALVNQWLTAEADELPSLAEPLRAYGRWTGPEIERRLDAPELASLQRQRLELARAAGAGRVDEFLDRADLADELRPPMRRILARSDGLSTDLLVRLLLTAAPAEFAALRERAAGRADVAAGLRQRLADPPPPPVADFARTEAARNVDAAERSRAAVALYQLGDADAVWPLLRAGRDNRLRSHLVHDLGRFGSDPAAVLDRLGRETDAATCRAVVLAIGGLSTGALTPAQRDRTAARLTELFAAHPDAGVHGASAWVLRRWGLASAGPPPSGRPAADRSWFVGPEGLTFTAVRGPVEFAMGAAPGESDRKADTPRHRRRILRSFAVATTEVTVFQYLRCKPDYKPNRRYNPDPDCPATGVSWFDAAEYCNWLSERAGLPKDQWCYVREETGGWRLARNCLGRTGYRLPTEAEWEYVARGNTTTPCYFGSGDELLGRYAHYAAYSRDRAWPVGLLPPNDFGAFDVLGNAMEWALGVVTTPYPNGPGVVATDDDPEQEVPDLVSRALRGGAFYVGAADVRSARRFGVPPGQRSESTGFRVARTLPAS